MQFAPTNTLLKAGSAIEKKVQIIEYGTNAGLNNIGQIENIYCQDGKTSHILYDFKNNLLSLKKQFATDYQNVLDFNGTVALQTEEFITQTTYDALNRPIAITHPNSTVTTNVYNKAGLLQKILKDEDEYISNINYNARGQRTEIYYGNASKTAYTYHTENFRLIRLLTTKNTGSVILQDLNYTYDSVGNITQVEDNAQQTVYFANSVIAPISTYQYDALYRLIAATGRELASLSAPGYSDFANNIPNPNTDANAMQTYFHEYVYDKLGNILSDNWKDYFYDTATNRLLKHDEHGQPAYTYDAHGNILSMPHLISMGWDYKDELVNASKGTLTSFYNYDTQGKRSRKVVEKSGGIREERYYIGGYEVFRKYISNSLDKERETIHFMDDRDRFAMIDTLTLENGTTLTSPIETLRYQYSNHLGSACLELDSAAAIISYEEYHPSGTTSYRSGKNELDVSLKRYKYLGKERDEETGLYYYGARYYAGWLGHWISTDPQKEKRIWLTPYNYCQNNIVNRVDFDGMLDDVYITGSSAAQATQALSRSSSLTIVRDEDTGKLSATGKAKTAADNMLLKAIESKTIDVNLVTKSKATYDSKDGTKGWPLVPGGFEGSEIINGKVVATQYLNFEAAENVAKIIGEKTGETIMHEINEAYIGARDYPGGSFDNAYQGSHNKAAKLDRVKNQMEFNKNTKSYPANIIIQGRVRGSNNPWSDIIRMPR